MQNLIFDFDGTIVDSGALIYNSLVEHTQKYDLNWQELKNLSSDKVIKAFEISKFDLPFLILKIRKEFKSKIAQQPIVPEIKGVMLQLKQLGYRLHILSSNSEKNISNFLRLHDLRETVESICSTSTIFGKARSLKKILNKLQCSPDNAIYIGDETRDIEAARAVGMKSLAVTWGYNSESALAAYNPDYLVKTPPDLLPVLKTDRSCF